MMPATAIMLVRLSVDRPDSPSPTVQPAQRASLAPALFGIGTVQARRAYFIGPTAAARVLRVMVDVGDTVQAGQLLAEMDPVDLDERLAALDAALARAGSTAAAAEAQRQDVLARKELAQMNARRDADLASRNFISAGALEARLQEQTSAAAAVLPARASAASSAASRSSRSTGSISASNWPACTVSPTSTITRSTRAAAVGPMK